MVSLPFSIKKYRILLNKYLLKLFKDFNKEVFCIFKRKLETPKIFQK